MEKNNLDREIDHPKHDSQKAQDSSTKMILQMP